MTERAFKDGEDRKRWATFLEDVARADAEMQASAWATAWTTCTDTSSRDSAESGRSGPDSFAGDESDRRRA